MHPLNIPRLLAQLESAYLQADPGASQRSQEKANLRRVQEQYAALTRNDFDAALAHHAEDSELELVGPPGAPLAGRWRGKQAVADALRHNFAQVEIQDVDVLSVVAQGDQVAVCAREQGCFRATGKSYRTHWTTFFTFREGMIAHVRLLFDAASILEAARPG